MAWAVVIGTIVAVAVVVAVLARQGNPADLSEQDGHHPMDDITERPAGPDAEPTGVGDPGSPSIAPERDT